MASIPLALVYFAGWSYLTAYLGQFGIESTEIVVPLATVLVYAFRPLRDPMVVLYLLFMVFVIAAFGRRLMAALRPAGVFVRRLRSGAAALFLTLLLISMLWLVWCTSERLANNVADQVWDGGKPVTYATAIVPDGNQIASQTEPLRAFLLCRDEGRMHEILGFPDRIYLLCMTTLRQGNFGSVFLVLPSGAVVSKRDIGRSVREARG